MIHLWPLLLPVAAWSGWWMAKRHERHDSDQHQHRLSREYVVGLNYLLNEQPDKAVDVFIKLLEVDSDTVETHLALGSLFRRRGEVDRAIRIHQNLIARPQLSPFQRKEALTALGQDYMSAGVFDRAERIFLEVVSLGFDHETHSLRGLLAIYQQEKAWEKSLEMVKKLENATSVSMHVQTAHYYCELAEEALKNKTQDKALALIKQALTVDRQSVRGNLLLANVEMQQGRYKQAIRALKQVVVQDPDFLNETLEPLIQCYRALDNTDECMDYLEHTLQDHPRSSVIFVIGEHLSREKSVDFAMDFVSTQLSRHPSIRGLNRLIHWHFELSHGKIRDELHMLYAMTRQFVEKKPIYRCGHCGFGGKILHWYCPSCKQWGRTKPIHGLEGD